MCTELLFDTRKQVVEMTVHHLCETHELDVSDSFADALDDSVTQETQATVKRHAKEGRNPPEELWLKREAGRRRWHFQLYQDVVNTCDSMAHCSS